MSRRSKEVAHEGERRERKRGKKGRGAGRKGSEERSIRLKAA